MANDYSQPVSGNGWLTTPRVAGMIVAGALLFLILIRHGFRGISVGGVSLGVN